MRPHHTVIVLCLIAALCDSAAAQDGRPDTKPVQAPAAPPKAADPPPHMANFARLVGGEWQVTFTSGESAFHSWHWGPGKHSMRKMTDGSDVPGFPWAGEVMYWHPGRKQVRLLTLHGDIPGVGRGVGEGTVTFEGETANGVIDLHQPRGPRKLGLRWAFDGPDKCHDTLLEDSGAGLRPLAEWDFVRIKEGSRARPRTAEEAPPPISRHLKDFEALLGGTWEAKGESGAATGNALHIQSTYEWVPFVDAVCARVIAPSKDGGPAYLLEAYFYQHVGTGVLRCLALSSTGGVYEGDLTVLDGGALQLDLKGYEGDRIVQRVARFDFEQDGTLRTQVWSLDGTERTLMLDVHHKKG